MLDLQTLLNDHEMYHSELQQDQFITVRAGGTLYGQYKQALRELYKRFRGLKGLYYDRDKLQIDIDEASTKYVSSCEFQARRDKLEQDKRKLDMVELQKNVEDTEREFKRFYQQAHSLKSVIGELTPEKRNKLDKDMWLFKIKEMCVIDLVSAGRLKNTTYELITCLDKEDRMPLLEEIKHTDKLLAWYESKDFKYELLPVEVDLKKLMV